MTSKELAKRLTCDAEKLTIISAALEDYNYENMARIIRGIRNDMDFVIAEINVEALEKTEANS